MNANHDNLLLFVLQNFQAFLYFEHERMLLWLIPFDREGVIHLSVSHFSELAIHVFVHT